MTPGIQSIDHVHIFVSNRAASEQWYKNVLGFTRTKALEFWATDGGPLTVENAEGTIHLALFEKPPEKCRTTIAFRVSAEEFLHWQEHLQRILDGPVPADDHQVAWSLYFNDPDGNPYEITSYEYQTIKDRLPSGSA